MNHTLLERAKIFLQAHKNKSIWHRITTSLAAVVVFVTTYMLILPAITMERPTICGLEEHTHTKACYASSLKDALHEHDDSCYDANGNLVCQRPVVRLHEHTDECYKDANLICGQIAYQGHTHTDACYTWEKVLVCGEGAAGSINADGEILIDEDASETPQTSAHVHTDDCYKMEKVLTCLLAEGPGHTHTAACYDGPRQLICGHDGMAEIIRPNSAVEYVSANDTGKILICGKKEHKHTDSCYPTETTQSETKAQTETAVTEKVTKAETEAVTETQAETLPASETQMAEMETQTATESETTVQTEQQTEAVTEAATEKATETEPVTEAAASTESEIATEQQTTVATETEVTTEKATETELTTETLADVETELATETQTEFQTDAETEIISEAAKETGTEAVAEPQTETVTEVGSDTEPETSTEIETETESEPEITTETSTEIEVGTEPESEAETETGTEVESDTEIATDTESESETEIGTEVETEIESEIDTWTDEALEEAFKDGTIDSYCIAQRKESSRSARKKAQARNAVSQGSVEFGQYLTNATVMKQENGKWVASSEFDDGDQVKVSLSYSIPSGKITADQKQIYYQLPSGVRPLERQAGKAYHGGKAVGDYVIDTDGMITIDFYDEFANGDAFTGNIDFSGTVTFADAGDDGKISFGGTTSNITIKKPTDIKTEKTAVLSEDKEKISYTVKVSTVKGTSDTVSIEDCFVDAGGNLKGEYKQGSFKIYKVSASGEKTELSGYTPTIDTTGNQQSFKIDNLPKLEAGEAYEVTYEANAAQAGSSDQANNGAGSVKNKAVAKSGSLQSESSQTIEVSKKMVEKSGYQSNDVIKWTITVNEDKRDITGYTLEDILPENVELVGEYVITDSDNKEVARGSSFPYTFNSQNPMKDTYKVTFNTTVPDTNGEGKSIVNTAKLKKGNKEYEANGTAWVSRRRQDWDLSKKYQGMQTDGDGAMCCKWRTEITFPDGKTEDFTYKDTIVKSDGENLGNHYTYASKLVDEIKNSLKLQIKGVDGEKGFTDNGYADFEIICYDENGNRVDHTDDHTPVKSFEVKAKPTSEFYGRKLYFDYTTIADTSGMQPGETLNFKNGGELKDDKGGTLKGTDATGDYTKPKPVWGLSKNFSQETETNGEVRYKWNTNISLPAETTESFTYTDTILEPESSNGEYEKGDYHYAYASELIQAIKNSLRLEIKDENDVRLTDDQGTDIENKYVEIKITCYDADGNPVTDDTTHVQSFKVEVTKKEGSVFEWKSLHFDYTTVADYSKMQSGETWTFKNKGELDKDNKESTASHEHTSPDWKLSKKLCGSTTEGDKASCEWETIITLPENEKKEFTYTDTILEPEGSDGDYHYAYASELTEAIKASLRLKIKNGDDIQFNSHQENAFVSFEIICYDAENQIVDNQDSQTHVQRFEVKVKPNTEAGFQWESLNFKYKTVADYSGMEKGDTREFPNQGEVENRTSKDEHTYTRSNRLSKEVLKDGKYTYTSEDVQVDMDTLDGILSYRLLITTMPDENGDIVIKDTLPSGATYVENSIEGYFYVNDNHYYQKRYNAAYDFGNDAYRPVVKINPTEDGQQLVIMVKGGYNVKEAASETKVIELQYQVSVKDDPFWNSSKNEAKKYTNDASWEDNHASQTTEITRKEIDKLQKTAEQLVEKEEDGTERKTNRVKYTVKINPGGKDLDPHSDKLTLKDKLTKGDGTSAEADLELDTVKLYYLDESKEDGIGGLIAVSDYSLQYDEANHEMTLTIPDETPCILVYVYAMDVGNAVDPTYQNKAELVGIYSTQTESQLKDVDSSAGVQKKRIDIYKVDSKNHTQLLDGATFKLEAWENGKWTKIGIYEAKEGHLELNAAVGGDGLAYNMLYKVTEETPPAGYAKTDQEYYFIYMDPVSNPNAETDKAWNSTVTENSSINKENVAFVGKDGKTIYVPNQATSIKVQKVWADSKGQEVQGDSENITVKVKRSTRKPEGYEVHLKFMYIGGGVTEEFPNQIQTPIIVKPGSDVIFYGTIFWNVGNPQPFEKVLVDGKEIPLVVKNDSTYATNLTVSGINKSCTITVYVGRYKYNCDASEQELLQHISYISPTTYTEDQDMTFGSNGFKEIHLNKGNNWSELLRDLEVTDKDDNPYYYTVEEVGGENYNVVYTNNGIQTGTIYIKNTIPDKENSYILPETGGPGSRMYMIGGAMLALLAAVLLYIKTASRRDAVDCATPSEREHFRNDCIELWSDGSNKRGKEDSKSP